MSIRFVAVPGGVQSQSGSYAIASHHPAFILSGVNWARRSSFSQLDLPTSSTQPGGKAIFHSGPAFKLAAAPWSGPVHFATPGVVYGDGLPASSDRFQIFQPGWSPVSLANSQQPETKDGEDLPNKRLYSACAQRLVLVGSRYAPGYHGAGLAAVTSHGSVGELTSPESACTDMTEQMTSPPESFRLEDFHASVEPSQVSTPSPTVASDQEEEERMTTGVVRPQSVTTCAKHGSKRGAR